MTSRDQNQTKKNNKPVIGITLGDINGIGPEVVIKTLNDSRILNLITPVIFGSTKTLAYYRKMFELHNFQYSQVKAEGMINYHKINVVNCWEEMVEIKVGSVTTEGGQCAYKSLTKAVNYLKKGHVDALVTAPINKKNIHSDDFDFVGHTDYLTTEFEAPDSLMLMVSENVRVGLVSAHVPIREVANQVTTENVESKLKIFIKTLREDFGIEKPKIAVLGLNPHAGEEGMIGTEEVEVLDPLINKFRQQGKLIFGPFPPDGFFATLQHKKYDGILAMYHDQGLIPFKLMDFEMGVNYTAGLSIIRTSPDHGTAYGIAGKNISDHTSMQEAVYLAAKIVKNRKNEVIEVSKSEEVF